MHCTVGATRYDRDAVHAGTRCHQWCDSPVVQAMERSSCGRFWETPPWGDAYKDGVLQRQRGEALPLGKGCIIKRAGQPCGVGLDVGMEMKTSTSETHTSAGKVRVAILSIGTRLVEALQAAQELEGDIGSDKGTEIAANDDNNNHNNNNNNEKERDTREDHVEVGVTVADARFMKPLDKELLRELARTHDALLTVEEGSVGGFGAHVLQFLAEDGLLDGPRRLCVRTMHVPDEFIEAGTQRQQYDIAQLNQQHIVQKVRQLSKGLCPPSRQRSIEVADSGSGHEQQQYRYYCIIIFLPPPLSLYIETYVLLIDIHPN